MERLGPADPEDDLGSFPRLAPSPHSEAVAHELQELSLHPVQCLPPLNERKNVLQLRLQQRRTREQLVDQGIMPPLKSPAAFHEQIKSLERARTENFLKHKIRSRPDRSELVRMHILEETFAEPSLQATQMKLKRARLADDLNEKIAQRPGPMELVEKNILPVDSSVKEAIIDYVGPLIILMVSAKVAELKMELKLRGLPVSGTKMDLIERLKSYQDLNNNSVSSSNALAATTSSNSINNPGEIAAIFPVSTLNKPAATSVPCFPSETPVVGTGGKSANMECLSSSLPISPSPSEHSNLSADDATMADTLTEIMTLMSPPQLPGTSPARAPANEDGLIDGGAELAAAEKDRRLKEKERQIEELKQKLEQEQKLVEVLKMQLEVEKRGHQQPPPAPQGPAPALNRKSVGAIVKEEVAFVNCSDGRPSLSEAGPSVGQAASVGAQNLIAKKAPVIKQEVPVAKAEPPNIVSQFYVSSQGQPPTAMVAPPQTVLTTQGTAQLLLPLPLQGPNPATSVQLPVRNVQVQVFPSTSPNAVFSYQNQSVTAVPQPLFSQASSAAVRSGNQAPLVQNGPSAPQKPASPPQSQQYGIRQPLFSQSVTKTKDPPRYEEAIKQTRSVQASQQEVSCAHSQQMDDLFDILIKSGEISLPTKEEPSLISKMNRVTASITTMPVNTVVSRPPPQVQMAPPLSLESTSNFSICLENQLEALLEGTLPSGNEMPPLGSGSEDRGPFSLIEDLQNDLLNHSGIIDHSQSPMETADSQFTTTSSCLSLDLPDTNLDNMEWLDITMPNSSSGLTPLSATTPSMFSADFLDPQDLQLHWD
ncbi:LOW QUALITY PROTEIN: myocardin-related transcription factor B [Sphaerodactylus townsendi]|uniref:LOW QUALITY PROTEIN: myocardin-related transcription factor B n=1 Tax=Sphaerodactylus townsendi TaxID=933632 RepID=UPI002026A6B8|nr:LOW QUALITY PROTEIN: myocardin-related transcription factor B [Sphaerodactylus townsendi]